MREFVVDELYFMLSFADDDQLYPILDAIVFLGRDVDEDEVTRDTWCFQDVESYCRYGRYPDAESDPAESAEERIDVSLYALHDSDLQQIVDSRQLAEIVRDCESRRALRKS